MFARSSVALKPRRDTRNGGLRVRMVPWPDCEDRGAAGVALDLKVVQASKPRSAPRAAGQGDVPEAFLERQGSQQVNDHPTRRSLARTPSFSGRAQDGYPCPARSVRAARRRLSSSRTHAAAVRCAAAQVPAGIAGRARRAGCLPAAWLGPHATAVEYARRSRGLRARSSAYLPGTGSRGCLPCERSGPDCARPKPVCRADRSVALVFRGSVGPRRGGQHRQALSAVS